MPLTIAPPNLLTSNVTSNLWAEARYLLLVQLHNEQTVIIEASN